MDSAGILDTRRAAGAPFRVLQSMMMLMLEVAGTQGSLGCFAFACCSGAPSLAVATVHEVWRRILDDNVDMQR
jgi:hypothetical protein